MLKTVRDVDAARKRMLVRVDFNVPLEEGSVTDDTRIRASLYTIRYLLEQEARVILCSHLGRPGGKVVEELRMDPVAQRLADLLQMEVSKANDCVGEEVEAAVEALEAGQVLLLENTRFHAGEKANDPGFAAQLASLADLFVNDAFAAAHRAHASTAGVAQHLPAVAGLLMQRELETLQRVRENPQHPFVAILGGAKISDKIQVIQQLLEQVDVLLVGGGMANTFLKAKGFKVGKSLIEEKSVEVAGELLNRAGDTLRLPIDVVVAQAMEADAEHETVLVGEIPPNWRILDIGPRTIERFRRELDQAEMVMWNGPLGVFEMSPFAKGTFAIARAMAALDAETITGGGETAAAVNEMGVAEQLTHVSTGGGAFLTFMEGQTLPGVAALDE